MFRRAVAILLMFFLLWGNSGFCLNVHYCATSEAFSVMVNHLVGERCGDDDLHQKAAAATEHTDFESCCKKLEQTLPSLKKDCCSDTEMEVKITDAFQGTFSQLDIQKQWTKALYIPLAPCFCHYAPIPVNGLLAESDPPDIPQDVLLSGKDLLIQHSVFRI